MAILGGSATLQVGAGAATMPPETAETFFDHNSFSRNDDGHFGNGAFNRTQITINSPVFNRGLQNSNDGVISGSVNTQNAFCKKWWHHCKIVQKMTAFHRSR